MANKDQLKQDIDAFVERVWPEVLDDIADLVSVRSVEDLDHAAENAPWGPGPREALDEALCIADRVGLAAHDCDGFIGFADLPGASDKQIATIAHVDVVPEGPGWHTDPFEMVRREGWLLGRGTIDDKGPAVLSLHAARFFAERVEETGERMPYTLRVLLGANEETRMGDVEWYLEHYPQPDFLFTPDAEFPVCCGEKGQLQGTFSSKPVAGSVAGARILARITAHGIGGHASLPEGTRNAIGMLCGYLLDNGLCSDGEREFLELERVIHADTHGAALGIDATDDIFDPLTCVGGLVSLTADGRIEQTVDCRYPKSTTSEAIEAQLARVAAGRGAEFSVIRTCVPFYVDPSSPEIQTLVRCYNEYTGLDTKPFTIGGGTYARHFARAASFGPEEPHQETPEWVGQMHGPDEGASEKQLRQALKIYIYAIAELMELEL